MHPRAVALIQELKLQPHPEGGFYREVFRSPHTVAPEDGRPARSALTGIYFLLVGGGHSRWHRVESDEAWCWLEGDPVELFTADGSGEVGSHLLGALQAGQEPIRVVDAGDWQAARCTGEYALVSCLVAPGFDFADFTLMSDDARAAEEMRRLHPELASLI